ncbi:MAG: outer membrane protein assembly factor BamD [Planctomycetes bacterium]|nr:outer membrane protein assembly factor BamD [Planctomycetota bacterium]MCP4839620.1 outer membrane protein assembly factor BamD [Planctomycetota bacterium]
MNAPRGPLLAVVAALAAPAALCPQATGQEVFRLGPDDEWAHEASPAMGSPAEQLSQARVLLAEGRPERSLNMVNRWMKRHPTSPLIPEAYLLRGDSLMGIGDEYESLYDYEYLARRYPGSEVFTLALEREFEIAVKYAHGLRRKIFGLRIVDASDEAEELLIRIQERLPGSGLAERAGLQLADMYFRHRRMSLAAEAYSIFIERYPRSTNLDFARRRVIYSNIASFKGPQFDIVGLLEAKAELKQLESNRPAEAERIGAGALILRIEESESIKMLTTARWYLWEGDPISCEYTIRELIRRFPRSAAAVQALREIPTVLAQLPTSVLDKAPDYATLREKLLNTSATAQAAESSSEETAP